MHLDWHVGHYAKVVLDEVFGYENFLNEIVWKTQTSSGQKAKANKFGNNHDTLLFYRKGEKYNFSKQYIEVDEDYIKKNFTQKDEKGWFKTEEIQEPSKETLKKWEAEGRLYITSGGKIRKKKWHFEFEGILVDDVWYDFLSLSSSSSERLNYSTQKPEALLKRIIKASSNEGDLVLDCFCGSGTTPAVAEKLGRRWIACDLGRFAIHTTRKRLLSIPNVKPFVVQNLGKYERQAWIKAEFEDEKTYLQKEKAYRNFILDLYHARSLEGYIWIYGVKSSRVVHVGNVDSPITVEDVKRTILEFWKLTGKALEHNTKVVHGEKTTTSTLSSMTETIAGIDFLGWEFAFDMNETAKQFAI